MVNPLPFKKNTGTEQKRSFDKLHPAQTVIDSSHRAVHEGFVFYVENLRNPFPANTTDITLLRVGGKAPHLQNFRWSLDYDKEGTAPINTEPKGRVLIQLYEGSTVSSTGTVGIPVNRNRVIDVSNSIPSMQVYRSPTVVNIGTLLSTTLMPSTGYTETMGMGGVDEWILRPNTDYIATIANQSNSACILLTKLTWYELDYMPPTQEF